MLEFDDGPPFTHFHLANLYSLPIMRTKAPEALGRARRAGLTTSLDTGWDALGRWVVDLAPCLPHVDLLFVNESEAKNLTGHDNPDDIVRELRAGGATDVVVKLGGLGCIAYTDDQRFAVPAFSVNVIDTTGAGDAFGAGFLAALHRGMSFADAARFANAVGALSVERLGTVQGVRSFEETQRWITAQNSAAPARASVERTDP
jgi:sugar/nucleoside kinase (ribokinase family)